MLLLACATARERHALEAPFAGGLPERVRFLETGVGVINGAYALGRELTEGGVHGVINLGLAGSFDLDALPLGSICVVHREIWPEYGLGLGPGPEDIDARALRFPVAELDGRDVWDRLDLEPGRAAKAMHLTLPTSWPSAMSLTVSTVSATRERANALMTKYSPALENMEGFALALACARARVPFLEIRTVSNLVGSRDPEDWDFPAGFAALASAARTVASQLDDTGNDG